MYLTAPSNPFPWPGSKARLMPTIVGLMPDHVHYVDVFGGTGASILRKPRSRAETFNDLNADVVNLFRVLADADARRALVRWIAATCYSRREFERAHRLLGSGESDPVARAWAFVVAANQRQVGAAPDAARAKASSWGYARLGPGPARAWPRLPERLLAVAGRFRGVQIENRPWDDILARYDSPETLFYLDPPYLPSTRRCAVYKHEMTEGDHRRLLSAVRKVRGRVILSGYASPLYAEALADWTAVRAEIRCLISRGATKPVREERIWLNYQPMNKI